jgi:hypothetical protein
MLMFLLCESAAELRGPVSVELSVSSVVGAPASSCCSSSGARGGESLMVVGSVSGGMDSVTAGELVAASLGSGDVLDSGVGGAEMKRVSGKLTLVR